MRDPDEATSNQTWHEDDFLVHLLSDSVAMESRDAFERAPQDMISDPSEMKFGTVTLALAAGDARRHERLALLQSRTFLDRDLHSFGARVRSSWAFDALVSRLTRQAHTWESLRTLLLAHAVRVEDCDPMLDEIELERLFALAEMLHERGQDDDAERALVEFIAHRVLGGGTVSKTTRHRLIERALQFEDIELARKLFTLAEERGWPRLVHSLAMSHPRFGGSLAAVVQQLNEPFRRLGLEPIGLTDEGETPFDRLHATGETSLSDGPLVSVVVVGGADSRGVATAVRSIVGQTYRHWELLLVSDGDARTTDEMTALAQSDSRIRVVVSADAGKTPSHYLNEGIDAARGELITSQTPSGWSHPRRLEIQVADLLEHPGRPANLVFDAHVDTELFFVTDREVKLAKSEATLMLRAELVRTVGRHDVVPEGAEREYRKRIELVTSRPVPALVPGAPLQITVVPTSEVRGVDYGIRSWEPRELTVYRSAAKYQRVRFGQGYDIALRLPSGEPAEFDIVLVLDGRESPRLRQFHEIVAAEISRAVDSGLRVGMLHSDALLGAYGTARFAHELEGLVQSGAAVWVDPEGDSTSRLLVVRHAGAAQGHAGASLKIAAERVVVVEDASAGDARGLTIAAADVEDVVRGWSGRFDGWVRASAVLPTPSVGAIAFDPAGMRLTIQSTVSHLVRAARITNGTDVVELEVVVGASDVIASATPGSVGPGTWRVVVDHAAGGEKVVARHAPVSADAIIWNQSGHIAIRAEDGGVVVLDRAGDAGTDALERHYLAAEVSSIRVSGEQIDIVVDSDAASFLVDVFAQREVDGGAIRRRDFKPSTAAGRRTWSRPLAKFADSRWRLYGAFRTSVGVVCYPIGVGDGVATEGTALWTPQVLSGDRILVAPPVPTRMQRAARRITSRARVDALRRSRGAASTTGVGIQFDARHSQPRVTERPTVSVVMPVYNVEPYLDDAISSVLNQDFRDLELILVDDASKDGGRRIIQKYWRKDPRVRVFGLDHNTLGGAGIPSNVGIRAARGAYVAFADSDDHVTATGLAKLVEAAETNDAELVIGDFRTFTDKLTEGTESYDRKVWDEMPLGTAISAVDHPALFRLSPVPWRKLYRRSFLEQHGILYPEGDYFYEDNPLHWFVLSRARRVVLCDEVISFHRMEREGQTMSAQTYKLGAFVNHMNTVLNSLVGADPDHRDVLFASFANYLDRTLWVATKQTQPSAAAMIRRGFAEVYERASAFAPNAEIPEKTRTKLTTFRSAYPDLDLTIVVPVFNSSALLKPTIDSVLAIKGLRFDLLLVDDGSTDDSLSIMEDYEKRFDNVHVFAQGNRGAGRARNSVIPLASGRYTYFLDADDVIDANALVAAVRQADDDVSDLVFMKYRIEYTDEGRSRGMFDADREAWSRASKAVGNRRRQQEVAQLINYPWNRLIRTRLLHDANIFFGPTVVNNDVLYHWHSIAAADRITMFEGEVCIHRKFTARKQITNISDARRMAVLEALRGTHERISPMESYAGLSNEWNHFAQHLLSWSASRIPEELRPLYELRRAELTRELEQAAGFSE